ncbi:hint-domain-containing protein [Entophlyctis helioformis]|nr:hint-domain-containing protein [Entophlyctis helioformis]
MIHADPTDSPAPPPYSPNDSVSASIHVARCPSSDTPDTDPTEHLLVRLASASKGIAASVNLVCVIDVSGSMGEAATIRNEQNTMEDAGMAVLDVIKHAMLTIINALKPSDSLAIVTFTNDSAVVLPLTPMDAAGQALASSAVAALRPLSMTNLWAGLERGLELLRSTKTTNNKLSSIFLFTDGVRNMGPAKGDVAALSDYKRTHEGLPAVISTFGFGNSLESADLAAMARIGCGSFSYIPDSGFTGTVFVNALANLLSTTTKNAILELKPRPGAQIGLNPDTTLPGGFQIINGDTIMTDSDQSSQIVWTGASVLVSIPNLRVDQPFDMIIPMRGVTTSGSDPSPFLEATLSYQPWYSDESAVAHVDVTGMLVDQSDIPRKEVGKHVQRLLFVDEVRSCLTDALLGAKQPELDGRIDALIPKIDRNMHKDLLVDLRGEARLALRGDNLRRWGRHYILSLTSAHALQICANFKDPGLQSYGGQLFRTLRDSFDAIFITLPPPKPSRKGQRPATGTTSVGAPHTMMYYHSSSRPCFAGNTLVLMANGSQRRISDLARGDVVATNASLSSTARVCCLVKTPCPSGMANLVTLEGGLRITPYHPVQQSGKWAFPCSIAEPASVPCDAVYNLVLDSNHTIIANGHSTVTLGHGVANDPVASHQYFGTRAVVDDLECMRGWSSGTVVLAGMWRDGLTGLVCGLCEAEQDHDNHQADALSAVSSASAAAVVVC